MYVIIHKCVCVSMYIYIYIHIYRERYIDIDIDIDIEILPSLSSGLPCPSLASCQVSSLLSSCADSFVVRLSVCVYIYIYIYTYIHIHTYIYTHIYIYVYIYIYIHTYSFCSRPLRPQPYDGLLVRAVDALARAERLLIILFVLLITITNSYYY